MVEITFRSRGMWGTVDTFLHFQPLLLYFKSKQAENLSHNKATLYSRHNVMPKHKMVSHDTSLSEKNCTQFEKGTFLMNVPHAWGALDMSMGYT